MINDAQKKSTILKKGRISGCWESNPVYTFPKPRTKNFLSESRESNPAFTHPKRAYCRYTTLRQILVRGKRAYLPRTVPLHGTRSGLPVYYIPTNSNLWVANGIRTHSGNSTGFSADHYTIATKKKPKVISSQYPDCLTTYN